MFQNFDLISGLSVIILDFSDKKIVSFKVYNVTRKFYEYSEYAVTLKQRWNKVVCRYGIHVDALLVCPFDVTVIVKRRAVDRIHQNYSDWVKFADIFRL